MEDSLQRMESSMLFVLVKLSIIRELLMVLVKVLLLFTWNILLFLS